jgi:hypothetical protein
MKTQRLELLNDVAKVFTFNGGDDNKTIIHRGECKAALPFILKLRKKILATYPKDFTTRLRKGVYNEKDALTVLRQMLRYHRRRLCSVRTLKYEKKMKKQICEFEYKIGL